MSPDRALLTYFADYLAPALNTSQLPIRTARADEALDLGGDTPGYVVVFSRGWEELHGIGGSGVFRGTIELLVDVDQLVELTFDEDTLTLWQDCVWQGLRHQFYALQRAVSLAGGRLAHPDASVAAVLQGAPTFDSSVEDSEEGEPGSGLRSNRFHFVVGASVGVSNGSWPAFTTETLSIQSTKERHIVPLSPVSEGSLEWRLPEGSPAFKLTGNAKPVILNTMWVQSSDFYEGNGAGNIYEFTEDLRGITFLDASYATAPIIADYMV